MYSDTLLCRVHMKKPDFIRLSEFRNYILTYEMERRRIMIGVLALQGAFAEHEIVLDKLGADWREIRKNSDLRQPIKGLILPGGESTVQGKLLRELGLMEPIRHLLEKGMPVLGTCAGLILLAEKQTESDTTYLGTLPVTVRRNGYGRQLGSFTTRCLYEGIGEIPMTFIRAPYIEKAGKGVRITAVADGRIVGVEYKNQIAISFHPELDDDLSVHKRFLQLVQASSPSS